MMLAWMFPGQGSQKPGLGRQLFADFPVAREILSRASDLCGHDLDALRNRGPQSDLDQPVVAEPLITATACAYVQILRNSGLRPNFVAGYSAGEVAALFSAEVLTLDDALKAAEIRGRILQRYRREDVRMVAVQKLARHAFENALPADDTVCVAGWNAPDHATLVGSEHEMAEVTRTLRRQGAELAEVAVAGPWHSPTIRDAAIEIEEALSELTFSKPTCKVSPSASGTPEDDPSALRKNLSLQVAAPVQWHRIMNCWWDHRVLYVWEVGAGQLLSMLRRNWTDYATYQALSLETSSGRATPFLRVLSARHHASQ